MILFKKKSNRIEYSCAVEYFWNLEQIATKAYRNNLKQRPGLNEHPVRMSAPLHCWIIYWAPRFNWEEEVKPPSLEAKVYVE